MIDEGGANRGRFWWVLKNVLFVCLVRREKDKRGREDKGVGVVGVFHHYSRGLIPDHCEEVTEVVRREMVKSVDRVDGQGRPLRPSG